MTQMVVKLTPKLLATSIPPQAQFVQLVASKPNPFSRKRLFIPHYSQNRGRRETCSFLRGCILASSFSSSSKSFASKRCDSAAFLLFKGHHIIRQSSLRPRRDLKKRFQEKFQSSSFLLGSERVLPIPNLPYLKACRKLKS